MNQVARIIKDLLIEEESRNLSAKSAEELIRNFDRFEVWCASRVKKLQEITPQFLLDYMLSNYADSGFSTKKSMIWSLRKFGGYLEFHGLLNSNPAKSLRHPKAHPREKLPEYLSEKEMRQLLKHLAQSGDWLKFTLISLFLNTGLRPGDLANIRLFQYFPKQGYFTGLAKGGLNKLTPLSDSLILILDQYISLRTDQCEQLLVNSRGKALNVPVMLYLVKEAAVEAGLQRTVTPRILRHTFATHLTDRHGSIMCKALLGHGSHRNTRVYIHLSPRRFRQASNLHPYQTEGHLYE